MLFSIPSYTCWIQDNWATPINANVFHDRIQEGVKVQVACITNVADTTNYRGLQIDLERKVNEELLILKHQSEETSTAPSNQAFQSIKVSVYPGILEHVKNAMVFQAQVGWVYVGKSKVGITMEILNTDKNLESLTVASQKP